MHLHNHIHCQLIMHNQVKTVHLNVLTYQFCHHESSHVTGHAQKVEDIVLSYPADVGGHARFGPETLDQALEQRGQIHLIDGGLREQITDASQRPGRRVSHHHTGVLHQLNEGRHGLTTHP